MEKCNYPNCRLPATLVPVIALPTLRSVGLTQEWVETDRPTYLVGTPLCEDHTKTYKLTDWMPKNEWKIMQEVGLTRGFKIPDPLIMPITFKPLGWRPDLRYMELERTNAKEE